MADPNDLERLNWLETEIQRLRTSPAKGAPTLPLARIRGATVDDQVKELERERDTLKRKLGK